MFTQQVRGYCATSHKPTACHVLVYNQHFGSNLKQAWEHDMIITWTGMQFASTAGCVPWKPCVMNSVCVYRGQSVHLLLGIWQHHLVAMYERVYHQPCSQAQEGEEKGPGFSRSHMCFIVVEFHCLRILLIYFRTLMTQESILNITDPYIYDSKVWHASNTLDCTHSAADLKL